MSAPHPRLLFVVFGMLSCVWSSVGCGEDASAPYWHAAETAEATGWWMSVWGPSSHDRFAVGGEPERGAVLRFDGTRWQSMALPSDVPLLNWVYGFAEDDVFVVGNGGTVLHFDGERWTRQTTPTEENLWGIWGSHPDALWAVGGSGNIDSEAVLLRRQDASWQRVPLPELDRPNVRALFKVWGTARDDVYAVGQRGAVLHWDGSRWTELHVGADDDLIALWGTGPDEIVVVGGRGQALISRWDGASWETRKLSSTPGLNGVWMDASGRAHVVGENGTALRLPQGSFQAEDHSYPSALTLHAIFGNAEGRLVAVGGNLEHPNGPYEGLLLEHLPRGSE